MQIRTGERRRRNISRKRLSRALQPPRNLQQDYLAYLFEVVAEVRKTVERSLYPRLPALLQQSGKLRLDALLVDTWADDVDGIIASILDELKKGPLDDVVVRERVAKVAGQINGASSRKLGEVYKITTGFDLFLDVPQFGTKLDGFVRQNVDLIKSVTNDQLERVRQTTMTNIRGGVRVESLQKQLAKGFEVTESRAALIARDQTLKFYGELNESRNEAAGVEEYIWDTSNDERVRDDHAALHGEKFRWDDPPVVDQRTGRTANPGQDYQCRCVAIPVIPGFEDLVEG